METLQLKHCPICNKDLPISEFGICRDRKDQGGFHEDKKLSVERKSFFRRLAEQKGSPRIDHESVLCFVKA